MAATAVGRTLRAPKIGTAVRLAEQSQANRRRVLSAVVVVVCVDSLVMMSDSCVRVTNSLELCACFAAIGLSHTEAPFVSAGLAVVWQSCAMCAYWMWPRDACSQRLPESVVRF